MTSQEKQAEFIKSYLKPTLKAHGYKTSGKTWWKDKGLFFIVINLQNSQWNSKKESTFCLNIGVALTEKLADKEKKKATCYDLATPLGEAAYLNVERLEVQKRMGGGLGYKITDETNVIDFINYFKIDLEDNILKRLDELRTLGDCVAFYDKFEFWGNFLRRQIDECGIVID
ncbi:MAG TPA: DUF4304 domain-containing protein [Pyrinomonadaceae bacterium]|nr:DUF4304 domain-containing protein [Pyrinomonadaceae bacterium]HMP63985.1 DUF4304 domain-containing protein [Pyrinomonadaceae bacterium]